MAEYRRRNRETINEQHKAYMVKYREDENNRNKMKAYSRDYQRKRLKINPSRYRGAKNGKLIEECGGDLKLYNILYRYGLTKEEFESLPKYCEVCGSTERLCVDHDHKTGIVRGTLCSRCNAALGMLKDNPIYIENLKKYITNSLTDD